MNDVSNMSALLEMLTANDAHTTDELIIKCGNQKLNMNINCQIILYILRSFGLYKLWGITVIFNNLKKVSCNSIN